MRLLWRRITDGAVALAMVAFMLFMLGPVGGVVMKYGHQPAYCFNPDIEGNQDYPRQVGFWPAWGGYGILPRPELRFWEGLPTCADLYGDGWKAPGISGMT